MEVKRYFVGQTYKFAATFRDEDGELYDPTDVRFELDHPDGSQTAWVYSLAELTRTSRGKYHKKYTVPNDGNGQYTRRWLATGTEQGTTGDVTFEVEDTVFD